MIDSHLLQAYRTTSFIIEAPNYEITLFVGEPNPIADKLLESYGVRTCAFVTAWNPHSRRLQAIDNKLRQDDLLQMVRTLGHPFLPGRGVGRDSNWPHEQSLLIVGVHRDCAVQLGQTFGQLAIVFKEINQPTELLLCCK